MDNENKRNRAASIYRILGLVQIFLGFFLLVLGGVGYSFHGKTTRSGAHYYSSAFLVGGFVIVLSVLEIAIYRRGRHCYSRERAIKRMTCLLQTYTVAVALNLVCSVTGMIITGLSGICKGDNCSYEENRTTNYGVAVTIVITIAIVFLTCVFGLIILCTHGPYFGISLFKRGQNRISNTSSSPVSMGGIGPFIIPTGQDSDQIRSAQNSLGASLRSQLEQQNRAHSSDAVRTLTTELPPIRGQHRNTRRGRSTEVVRIPTAEVAPIRRQNHNQSHEHSSDVIRIPTAELPPTRRQRRNRNPGRLPDVIRIPTAELSPTIEHENNRQTFFPLDHRARSPELPTSRGLRRPLPEIPMAWWPPPEDSPPPYSP